MFIKDWKRQVFTIPNLLSLFRLMLLPVYANLYLSAREDFHYFLAAAIMAISCLTDLVDGYIARKYNMVSNLGKVLDPLADKVTQFVLTLCLSLKYPALRHVLALFIVKEVFQALLGILYLRRGKMLPGALVAGKVCTTVLFISLIMLVLFPRIPKVVIDLIAVADSGFLLVSFLSYGTAYFGKHPLLEDLE